MTPLHEAEIFPAPCPATAYSRTLEEHLASDVPRPCGMGFGAHFQTLMEDSALPAGEKYPRRYYLDLYRRPRRQNCAAQIVSAAGGLSNTGQPWRPAPQNWLNEMKTSLDCFPCFLRQALNAIQQVSDDPSLQEQLLKQVCREAAELDLMVSPVEMGQRIQRLVRQLTGSDDPYRAIKRRFNDHALRLRADLRRRIERADDPFDMAVRLSIAGNRIDFGASSGTTEQEVAQLLAQAEQCLVNGSINDLYGAVGRADRILYLADNTGEIVLDRLLIERLPTHKVTVAVRGGAVINDATLEDAITAGLPDLVEVIDNGSDAPGTVLADCSATFLNRFKEADLIIAKGQGNYETLNDLTGKQVFFLLMVKCPVVATQLDLPVGSFVIHPIGQPAANVAHAGDLRTP